MRKSHVVGGDCGKSKRIVAGATENKVEEAGEMCGDHILVGHVENVGLYFKIEGTY